MEIILSRRKEVASKGLTFLDCSFWNFTYVGFWASHNHPEMYITTPILQTR